MCIPRIYTLLAIVVLMAPGALPQALKADVPWNAAKSGNPLVPGYFADPCCRKFGDTYYLYATPDGWNVGAGPFCIWTSKDFVHWTCHKSPGAKPGTSWPATDCKWAPSVVYKDSKYYFYSQTPCMVWGAVGDSPLGPWTSLSAEGQPLIPDQTPKGTIVLDGECFIDDEGQAYLWYGTWWTPTVAKLKPDMRTIDGQPIQYFKRPNMPDPPKGLIRGCMEAPYMLKRNGTYYLMYSNNSCSDSSYCVEYSTATSPLGPFTYGKNNPILSTNEDDTVDGPGHHTILEEGGKVYLIYHRHDNPHSADGAHRQIAVDELHFTSDGAIEKVIPSHQGVGFLAPSTVRDTNLAIGKPATASSFAGKDFQPAYAADENNGTLWKADAYKYPQWLQIDLGRIKTVRRAETDFQFPQLAYRYTIEYSSDGSTWKTFADRRDNQEWGVMIDRGLASGRYFRITLLGDSAPQRPNPEIGIWNLKLYDGIDRPSQPPKVDAGNNVRGSIRFPQRLLSGTVFDDGSVGRPVQVKWSQLQGPGDARIEHPDRLTTNASFPAAGKYVLKLLADNGQRNSSGVVTIDMLPAGDQLVCYHFDEPHGSLAIDSTPSGQNGVMRVGTGRSLGVHGGAVNLRENDFVAVGPLGVHRRLTISAWINLHTLKSSLSNFVGGNSSLRTAISTQGELCFAAPGLPLVKSRAKLAGDGLCRWRHVAWVYDAEAKQIAFYVDGRRCDTSTLSAAPAVDLSGGLKLGEGLDAEVDDFRLDARCLSESEIADLARPVRFTQIDEVKQMADGTPVVLISKVVTYAPMDPLTLARSSDRFYIAERDSSAGILVADDVAGQDHVRSDHCVSLAGVVKSLPSGERYIALSSAPSIGGPCRIVPAANAFSPGTPIQYVGKVTKVALEKRCVGLSADGKEYGVVLPLGGFFPKVAVGNTIEVTGVVSTDDHSVDNVILATAIVRVSPPADPLISHFTFDADFAKVVRDDSTYGNDARPVGHPKQVEGKVGKAIAFDGRSSYLELPDLGLQPALTISVWLKVNSLGSDPWSTSILHSDQWALGDLHFQVQRELGVIQASLGGGPEVKSAFSFRGQEKSWAHVAYTYDSHTRKAALYVNGRLEATAEAGEGRPVNLSHVKVGTWTGHSRFFDGAMDDFRIYDKALSQEEIARLSENK